jgi:hypothetical protein
MQKRSPFKGRSEGGFGVQYLHFSFNNKYLRIILERAAGIEPASSAWKAEVLPLHNARSTPHELFHGPSHVKRPQRSLQEKSCIQAALRATGPGAILRGTATGRWRTMELTPNWEFVADGVMGGVSTGHLQQEIYRGRMASVLRGDVSLDNNGGFVQIAFDLCADASGMDASAWDGIELDVSGNGEAYDLRLRTDQLTRAWQSFRTDFVAAPEWQSIRFPFDGMIPHRTEAAFDPARLRRVGVLGIGREFRAEVGVAAVRFYRT